MARERSSRLVYSTEQGRICPNCRLPVDRCTCGNSAAPLGDGRVRVGRSSKGRGGKVVTVITGLPLTTNELGQLATQLKKSCGSGGAVKDANIEIQGDHREEITSRLQALGYQVKKI